MVSAIKFCEKYIEWLEMIDATIRDEYYPAMRRMYVTPPEDFISPDACFRCEGDAIGFIYLSMLKIHKELQESKSADIQQQFIRFASRRLHSSHARRYARGIG